MADIKDRAREYIAKHSEYSEVFGQTFVAVDTLTAMVEFAEQETKELKEQQFSLRNERNTFLAQNEQYEKDLIDFNEKLTKAKELLKKIYNFEYGVESDFPKFDLVKWSIETRDFLKDSEVEK